MLLQPRELAEAITKADPCFTIEFKATSQNSMQLEEYLVNDGKPLGKSLSAYGEENQKDPGSTLIALMSEIVSPICVNHPQAGIAALDLLKNVSTDVFASPELGRSFSQLVISSRDGLSHRLETEAFIKSAQEALVANEQKIQELLKPNCNLNI